LTSDNVFEAVRAFYSSQIVTEGPTPAGVDWPDEYRQRSRFRELARLFPTDGHRFSLLDYGCGYGAMLSYIREQDFNCEYRGFDISDEMIDAARRLMPELRESFSSRIEHHRRFDFVVASGVFNVKLMADMEVWERNIWQVVDFINEISTCGFGFNVLSAWRESRRKRDLLYYGDPGAFLNRCAQYSPNVALLHDYDLWDFTILVRKNLPTQNK
jgi:SAM-dependent methyltransferase